MYIKLEDLTKNIKGNEVLKNINLELDGPCIYGFFGRNGSGKTMLFRIISGLVKPTSGNIYIGEKKIDSFTSKNLNLGVLIETPKFWDNYTGFENLKALSMIKRIIKDEDIINTLERVGLDPYNKKKVKTYSLGMKQKLGIAQAIMEKPDLIILDEPTNALDEESIINIREILREEKKRGATILICSHNSEDLNLLCDKKFKMVDGSLEVCDYEKN